MNAPARKASFFRELCLAVGLSLIGAAVFASLGLVLSVEQAVGAAATLIAFAYLCYELGRSEERTGRIAVVALWGAITAVAWAVSLPLGSYLVLQVALLWLVRSLYSHSGLLAAGADLALNAIALSIGIWTALRTDSFFLASWCFFLIQAMHVWTYRFDRRPERRNQDRNRVFDNAFHAAENALRRMTRPR